MKFDGKKSKLGIYVIFFIIAIQTAQELNDFTIVQPIESWLLTFIKNEMMLILIEIIIAILLCFFVFFGLNVELYGFKDIDDSFDIKKYSNKYVMFIINIMVLLALSITSGFLYRALVTRFISYLVEIIIYQWLLIVISISLQILIYAILFFVLQARLIST